MIKQLMLMAIILVPFITSFEFSYSLVNNNDNLILESGESIDLSGNVYKNQLIHIKSGATVYVIKYDGGDVNNGYLNLVAPTIIVEGTINGNAAGYNTAGKGDPPGTVWNGGGGAGHGGTGGRGDSYFLLPFPGDGGPTYNTSYQADTGSFGYRADYDTDYSGYGGSGIRLDAKNVTLGSTSQILASANQLAYPTVGGGSGGTILLDGITLTIGSGALLEAKGGPGGRSSGDISQAGGGGGGRIKYLQRGTFSDLGVNTNVTGNVSGGGNAKPGANGTVETMSTLPLPNAPTLMSPLNMAEVGTRPTMVFQAVDPSQSKFLNYQLFIAEDASFNLIFHESSQKDQGPGWGNKEYYSSNELAYYSLPVDLALGSTYYWSVSVTSDDGQTWIDASPRFIMSTVTTINTRPTMPEITLPSNGATELGKLPLFQIVVSDPDGDTLTCSLAISKNPNLTNAQVFNFNYAGWDDSSYLPPSAYLGVTATCQLQVGDSLEPGTTYYYQATAYDHLQQSRQSFIQSFTTVERPTVPIVIEPVTQSTVSTKQPKLSFYSTSPSNSQLYYLLELSSDDFQTIIVYQSNSGSNGWSQPTYSSGQLAELTIPTENQLVPGVDYSWRCQAYDITNQFWSLMTSNYTFFVSTPPFTPDLIAPADNYDAPDSQITFQFKTESEGGNTLNGRVEISTDQFQSIIFDFDQTSSQAGWDQPFYVSNSIAAFTIPDNINIDRSRNYQWRASFYDGFSWSGVSEIRHFSFATQLRFKQSKLYPNPAVQTDRITISYQLTLDAEVTCTIYNKLGKEIYQQSQFSQGGIDVNLMTINIANFAPGLYFYLLQAQSGDKVTQSKKAFAIVK